MKIVKALLVGMFVLGICKPVSAMDFDVKNIKYIGSLDMYSVANADDRMERRLKADKAVGGFGTYGLNTNPGYGFRIGALYPVENLGDVGLSWGYISGPSGERKVDGLKYDEYNRRFYRFMAEGRKTFKVDDKFSFLGGAGLGVGFGKEEFVYKGAVVQYTSAGALAPTTADKYFSGLAWELTAGATYKATDKMNVEAGLRYAGFPSCDADPVQTEVGNADANNGEFTGMNWTTLGFFVGVSF